MKRFMMIAALLVAGVVGSLTIPNTAEARPRYYGGGYRGYYNAPRYYNYGPRYYRPYNYGYRYNRSYYYGPGGYYGRSYYNGGGVYIGRGGVSIGW